MIRKGLILLVILLLVSTGMRVGTVLHLFRSFWGPNFFMVPVSAQAKEKKSNPPQKTPSSPPGKKGENPQEKSIDVKLEELKLREERLRQEEANLRALKKEIEAKLQQLKALQIKVSKLLKERDEKEEKRLVQLAHVFESTPPEQAGPLLSKLDVKTAAEILYRMNGRKAGKIWGYVDADRAVKISEELTKLKDTK